jgi:hypothetical protein
MPARAQVVAAKLDPITAPVQAVKGVVSLNQNPAVVVLGL